MTDSFTWTAMLAFAATTGIITAVLNQAFGILRDWRIPRSRTAGMRST